MQNISFKTELNPNNEQITLFRQYAGTARFVYNWGLAKIQTEYKENKKFPSALILSKELRQLKSSDFSWLYTISKWVPEESLFSLEKSLKRFLSDRKKPSGSKSKFPKFKSKKRSKSSFTLLGPLHVESNRIKVPKIGWLKLKEHDYIPTDRPIKRVTISERAGRWCDGCGSALDRDLNAAINLRNVAVGSTETENACGEESSGLN